MNPHPGLTVGHIPYLNCVPFFHYLRANGFTGKLVSGVPSALNWMLQLGELHISPSSSFEYARNWQDYLLLPGHSISSVGRVHSVLLFSPVALAELEGAEIAVTGESATSINLLRIILREFESLEVVTDSVPAGPVEEVIARQRPALLIGDRALHLAANCPAGMQIFDLGDIWYQRTGLPFVFALWMIRRSALPAYQQELTALSGQLQQSLLQLFNKPEPVAQQLAETSELTVGRICNYWQSINYRLDDEHLKGLRLFFNLCVKHNLLRDIPPLNFFQSTD